MRRSKLKRAGYLLYFRRDYALAEAEVKEPGLRAQSDVQQARDYAEILGLKFASEPTAGVPRTVRVLTGRYN